MKGDETVTKKKIEELKDRVQGRCENGELRTAFELERTSFKPGQINSIIRQACAHKHLVGIAVDTGQVRQALENRGWTDDEIDYLIYRSKSSIFD